MLRSKSFLTCFVICAVPLLLLAALNYWNATRSVNKTINTIVQADVHSFNSTVDRLLDEQGRAILKVAVTPEVQGAPADSALRSGLDASLRPVLELAQLKALAVYDLSHRPIWAYPREEPPLPHESVWTAKGKVLLERLEDESAPNRGLVFSVPIHDATGLNNAGAVVALVDLQRVFSTAARALDMRSAQGENAAAVIDVRDRFNNALYTSQSDHTSLPAATASAPVPRLNVFVSVSRSKAQFMSSARFWGVAGFVLALGLGLLAAFMLDRHVRKRSRGIARVTEDLSAIAKGELDRRIVLQSSDDARAIADNINTMTERLRAQIAREEESRQFESFVRISAMLTHDLKNAIEGLSLTVSNMERHFDNEQFRIDALKGLTNACDKLKALVNRLSRPVSSLSGEHRRPTKTDLIPIVNRVIAMTAEPMRSRHTIQTKLPANLYALADGARIEEIMENLILNAIEAMHLTSGTLTVEAGYDANNAPTICVSDTGPGMSRSFIENRLFRPFSTTKKHGIGLGLYTCREVIRAIGGSIEVQSVEGAGTTFRVVLPSVPNDRRN
jgi:signal transduction histidine kinase